VAERIVVGFLASATPTDGDAYVKRLASLREKAEALGGRLCAIGSQSIAFDFGTGDLEEAIALANAAREKTDDGAGARGSWGVAIAQGPMTPMVEGGSLALPSWGLPLVTAIGLARIAHPGEILIDSETLGVVTGEVLTSGSRTGKEGSLRLRGLVVDPRQAFRRDAAEENLSHLARPVFVGQKATLGELLASPGVLGIVRADPGVGGTRLLEEIESALHPGRSLHLATAGAEPLGALRRAFARSIAASGAPPTGALSEAQDAALVRILAGDGTTIDRAADLVAKWITLHGGARDGALRSNGAVLVDDAVEIDDPSLDAVGRAARLERGALRVVVRIDATSPLPSCFDGLERGATVVLGALPRAAGEELATAILGGHLAADVAKRWARRGRYLPLGIGEALAEGLTTGELFWSEGVAVARGRGSSQKPQLDPKDWIVRRLRFVSDPAKGVLRAIAILGTEVMASLVRELVLATQKEAADRTAELKKAGWLRASPEGIIALPSRTHREVLLAEMSDDERTSLHEAASHIVEKLGGKLASAEAARHAAMAGNEARAVELALVAARASSAVDLDAATEALLAFAGAKPEDIASAPPPAPGFRLDTWIEALRASGDREGATIRLEAIAALARGETHQALTVLRAGLAAAASESPTARSRAALAYGIALAVAGREVEALFAALEALARAREAGEPRGEHACTRFLARLSAAAGHPEAAKRWQQVAGEVPS
jgi:hypothetical protein